MNKIYIYGRAWCDKYKPSNNGVLSSISHSHYIFFFSFRLILTIEHKEDDREVQNNQSWRSV
jgi:hypothetical protein